MEFRKAAAELRAIWAAGNEYLQVAAPWTAFKTDPEAAAVGVRTGLNACALFAILAQPFIPDAAKTVLDAMGVPEKNRMWPLPSDRASGTRCRVGFRSCRRMSSSRRSRMSRWPNGRSGLAAGRNLAALDAAQVRA